MNAIYLALDGKQSGPFSLDQIRLSANQGSITPETPAWYEGLAEWITVRQVLLNFPESALPPLPPPALASPALTVTTDGSFTKTELREIVKRQNLLMWSVLAGFSSFFLGHIPVLGLPIVLVIVVFQIYALYTLGTSLRMNLVWLYCLGLFIPLVGLIILVVVSGKASKILKAAGIRVGLMGGKLEDITD